VQAEQISALRLRDLLTVVRTHDPGKRLGGAHHAVQRGVVALLLLARGPCPTARRQRRFGDTVSRRILDQRSALQFLQLSFGLEPVCLVAAVRLPLLLPELIRADADKLWFGPHTVISVLHCCHVSATDVKAR
jgi:hypothetical protein